MSLLARQIGSIYFIGLFRISEYISKQLGLIRLALDVHNVELNLYKLSDLAINSHQLRSLGRDPGSCQQPLSSTDQGGGKRADWRGRIWCPHAIGASLSIQRPGTNLVDSRW